MDRMRDMILRDATIIAFRWVATMVVQIRIVLTSRPGALINPATITPDTSPRGVKRSRSPDPFGDLPTGDDLGDDGTLLLIDPPSRRCRAVAVAPGAL